MAQADVFGLIDDLGGQKSDGTALAEAAVRARYYADVVFEHGLVREGPTDAAYVAVIKGTSEYTMPAAAIRTLGVIFDDTQLRSTARLALESYDAAWRSRQGRPRTYTTQDEDIHVFRLVAVPDQSGAAIGVSTPFSGAFPDGNLTFVYTNNVTDVPAWDELWVTLDVLSREFGRESDHYDPEFSGTAQKLAQVVRTLVGYVTPESGPPAR